MMWAYGYYEGPSWLSMTRMMLLFWAGLLGSAIWPPRSFMGPRQEPDSEIATLRQRLAAGQINEETFEKTKKVLHG